MRNHPLPDGNKRAVWVALRVFIGVNGWTWEPMPTVDEAERVMLAIAAELNGRPRKTLDWSTPAERMEALLR